LTDIIGFLLIIPVTRKLFISTISSKLRNKKVNNNKDIIEGSIDETQQDHNNNDS
jgi:UPF0716 family protein affecting phage T7 exclusion